MVIQLKNTMEFIQVNVVRNFAVATINKNKKFGKSNYARYLKF